MKALRSTHLLESNDFSGLIILP